MKKKHEKIALTILLIWVLYNIIVLLKTGFIGDDAYNSQIVGSSIQKGVSVNQAIMTEVQAWTKEQGRFTALGWYMSYGTYCVTQNPIIVKSVNILLILSGVTLFYFFSKRETGSQLLALLACFTLPILFQFRQWHDPILFFTFLIPTCFALIIGALVLFQKYLDNGRTRYLVAASVIHLLALQIYEITLFLFILFIAIAIARGRKLINAIVVSLPFTLASLSLIGASLIIRHSAKEGTTPQALYSGTELNLHVGKFIHALIIQVYSTFPLSFFFFNTAHLKSLYQPIDLIALALFWAGTAYLIHQIGRGKTDLKYKSWMICGSIMLIIPAALSSVSGHQAEIIQAGPGFGYITVYMQYFGLAAIAVGTLYLIVIKIKPRHLTLLAITLSGALTVMAGLNLGLNRAVALNTNATFKYPSELLKAALHKGLLSEIPDRALLIRAMQVPSDYTTFYTPHTGKVYDVCEITDPAAYAAGISKIEISAKSKRSSLGIEVIELGNQSAWISSYNISIKTGDNGRVFLSRINRIIQSTGPQKPLQVIVSEVKMYDLRSDTIKLYEFNERPIDFMKILSIQTLDISKIKPLDDDFYKAGEVEVVWSGGIFQKEGNAQSNVRWSSGNFTLKLYNLSDQPKSASISMELATPGANAPHLVINVNGETEELKLNSALQKTIKNIRLQPGITEILFKSDSLPIPNGDPRKIVFGVYNLNITHQ
ncbi:MAG: hypothetical protein H2172_02830 [Opitutus sp.]|nr:hypothetical protein [Opitutus sp.]MCS6277756.1 hypothetical protein [Opitutus sp.]MCS6299138.1 hypothetical protein [Opitutus sp.]